MTEQPFATFVVEEGFDPCYHVFDAFYIKDELKIHGGRWITTGGRKYWMLPDWPGTRAMLEGLKVEIRVKAMRAAFCHEDASVVYARLRDVEKGSIEGRLFCGNCDSQYGRTPVDVISIDDELPR